MATYLVKMSAVFFRCVDLDNPHKIVLHQLLDEKVLDGVGVRCALLSLRIQSLLPCSSRSKSLCGS